MNQEEAIEYLIKKRDEDVQLKDLCLKCGKCCRLAVPQLLYDELKEMKDSGNKEAEAFLSVFVPYGSWQDAKHALPDHFEKIVKTLSLDKNFELDKVTFYHCKYVTEDNLCPIYDSRPNCCKIAPANGWSVFPPECGYEGWQFQQREETKRLVRNLKELLEDLSLYSDDEIVTQDGQSAKELKIKVMEKIEPWNKYGAKNW